MNCIMDNILIVEDDAEIAELLVKFFSKHGLKARSTPSPQMALQMLRTESFSIVILDIMLPEQSGFSFCRELRKDSEIPIIILTARADVTDRIVGLELGADDYMTKPFEPRELLARMESIQRRTFKSRQAAEAVSSDILKFESLEIHKLSRIVMIGKKAVTLSATEFDVLMYLAEHPSEVISRDALISALRGQGSEVFDRAIDTLVSRVRNKIGDNAKNSAFIKTIRGAGYIFIAARNEVMERTFSTL